MVQYHQLLFSLGNIHSRITLRVHLVNNRARQLWNQLLFSYRIYSQTQQCVLKEVRSGAKKQRVTRKLVDLLVKASSTEFPYFPSSDRHFHVPQVANQKFHGIADCSSCLVCSVPSFTLFPGEEPGVKLGRGGNP